MRRASLPPEVTPTILKSLFVKIIKMKARQERAVCLRLEGHTFAEIVSRLDAEEPGLPRCNLMWVQRRCRRAATQLARFTRAEEKKYMEPGGKLSSDYEPACRVFQLLMDAGHEKTHRPQDTTTPRQQQREYRCPKCTSAVWSKSIRYVNQGGHRNIRIYWCLLCRTEVKACDRKRVRSTTFNPTNVAPSSA